MPRFSIVVTCTRPHLVQSALRSALAQDFADFEIVVSDNSDAGCRDVIEAFGDARIRYVRPGEYLTTVPHWNFAFSHAAGDWQLLLCDDDAIAPNLLSVLDAAIRAHPDVGTIKWEFGAYIDAAADADEQCRFTIPAFSGRHEALRCADVLRDMFASGAGFHPLAPGEQSVKRRMPLLTHAAYAKPLVEKIRAAFGGDLFLPICPMNSAATAALALSDRTLRIDLPLTVFGQTRDSAASHRIDPTTYEKMHRGASFEHVPVRSMSIFPTVVAESMLRARATLPAQLGGYELDWVRYFAACYRATDEFRNDPAFYAQTVELIDTALTKCPLATRMKVSLQRWRDRWNAAISAGRAVAHAILRRVGLQPRFADGGSSVGRLHDPRELALNGVADCAAYLGSVTR